MMTRDHIPALTEQGARKMPKVKVPAGKGKTKTKSFPYTKKGKAKAKKVAAKTGGMMMTGAGY